MDANTHLAAFKEVLDMLENVLVEQLLHRVKSSMHHDFFVSTKVPTSVYLLGSEVLKPGELVVGPAIHHKHIRVVGMQHHGRNCAVEA